MSGRKTPQPARKGLRPQHATHEIGFRQARRVEILARRLVVQRTVSIGEIEAARSVGEDAAHLRIVRDARPIPHQTECCRGLIVLAHADGVAEFPGPVLQPRRRLALQRLQDVGPLRGLRVVPRAQLRAQLEKPRKSIRPLERAAILAAHISQLAGDVLRRQTLRDGGARRSGEVRIGEQPYQPYQQPMCVHVRVPVVATVKGGRELARRAHIGVARERVQDMVRVFLMQALERQCGEAAGSRRIERRRRRPRGRARNAVRPRDRGAQRQPEDEPGGSHAAIIGDAAAAARVPPDAHSSYEKVAAAAPLPLELRLGKAARKLREQRRAQLVTMRGIGGHQPQLQVDGVRLDFRQITAEHPRHLPSHGPPSRRARGRPRRRPNGRAEW